MTPAPENPPRPTVHIPHPVYLYVIFDGPSGPESGRFVELEDEHGQGVGGATWAERGDGLWSLGPFLQPPAVVTIQPCPHCKEGWVCEAHPGKGWPHDDCAGPGKPCQQCTHAAYPTATEQPATDLGAMVEAILAETHFNLVDAEIPFQLRRRLAVIQGAAQRLKVALEREQAVMEEMAKAVTALLATEDMADGVLKGTVTQAQYSRAIVAGLNRAETALAKYKQTYPASEVIEPLELVAEAKLHCPCGIEYGPPKPGEAAERVTISIGNDYSGECVACHRTFRLVCRVEATNVEGEQ